MTDIATEKEERMNGLAVLVPARWTPGMDAPLCPRDPDHGPMRWITSLGTSFWSCRHGGWTNPCPGAMAVCRTTSHGEILRRSDEMGDSYCVECRAEQIERYWVNPSPAQAAVVAEATRRGGTCEFVLYGMRCKHRFEDGGVHWHHRDPSEKIASISTLIRAARLSVLLAELAKCDLLCAGHHRSIR